MDAYHLSERGSSVKAQLAKLKRTPFGLTLIELLIVMALTGILFGLTQLVLTRTIDTWWRVNAHEEAEQQLYKAQAHLERDLRSAAFETQAGRQTIAITQAPTALQGLVGSDGDVLWFLSAIDPGTGNFIRRKTTDNLNGTPFWQRNILYYAAIPDGLSGLGFLGTGLNKDGYEVACPYKLLIRKEIDSGPPTTSSSDPNTSTEGLLPYTGAESVSIHLKRPQGYDCTDVGSTNVTVMPIAAHMLSFRVKLIEATRSVQVDLASTGIDQAGREGPIGARDLTGEPSTRHLQFLVVPPNQPP